MEPQTPPADFDVYVEIRWCPCWLPSAVQIDIWSAKMVARTAKRVPILLSDSDSGTILEPLGAKMEPRPHHRTL